MKCHYKVLGIELEADDETIKKAYRKKALKWHPDKNRDNAEEATEQFRLIQAAYDVLIDPQERAWYDRHRNEILHKSQFSSFKDETSDILQFFTPSAYRGFGTDDKSFYAVYGDVFRKIFEEDKKFCSEESEDEFILPEFGEAESDYEEVVHIFYASWQAYSTKLSYVWVEKYDKHEAPERRVARLIEKENKKERDKEKKKRNEIVRDLVSFVRKRDPRVKAHKEKLEMKAVRQAEKSAARRAEILKARVEEAAEYEQQNLEERNEHEERVSQLEDLLKDEFGFSSDEEHDHEVESDDDDAEERLYCAACNKQFKTDKAFKNHERSKKHKEKVTQLRAEMQGDQSPDIPNGLSDSDDVIQRPTKLNKRQKKKLRERKKLFGFSDDEENHELVNPISSKPPVDVEPVAPPQSVDPFLDTQPVGMESVIPPQSVDETSTLEVKSDEEVIHKPTKKTKKQKKTKKNPQSASIPLTDEPDPPNFCVTCRSEFPSRNKLFQHLKSTGHSMPLEVNNRKGKKTKKH